MCQDCLTIAETLKLNLLQVSLKTNLDSNTTVAVQFHCGLRPSITYDACSQGDEIVVESFGDEWKRSRHSKVTFNYFQLVVLEK